MTEVTGDASEMYTYLMCKDGDKVITAQNSQIIELRKFDYDGYLVEDEEACEDFWKGGLKGKILFSKKLNILAEDGEVRLVDMVNEYEDGFVHYDDIDFKKFEFVRLEKLKAEISVNNFNGLFKAEINVYYPVFRLNA